MDIRLPGADAGIGKIKYQKPRNHWVLFGPRHFITAFSDQYRMSKDDKDIKLSYLPAQARIRLVISKAACDRSPLPPEDLIQRATKRLEQGVADGSLAFYKLYTDRLTLAWQRLRAMKFKPDKKIAVTLAAGAPPMPEIVVTAGPAPFLASLTINASAEKISGWKFEFVKLTVQKQLQEMQISEHPDSAMLQAVFLRALRGKKINRTPINVAPKLSAGGDQFSVTPRGVNGDLVLVINNISSVTTEAARASIMSWLSNYVDAASRRGAKNYLFLKDDVEGRLKSFLRGPERLSIDLPACILAAIAEPKSSTAADDATEPATTGPQKSGQQSGGAAATAAGAPAAPHARTVLLNFNGDRFFKITVDEPKMSAMLTVISDSVYDDPGALTIERLEAWLLAKNIRSGIKKATLEEIKAAIAGKSEVKSFEVASGSGPEHPETPYLHHSYKHKRLTGDVNLRDRLSSGFVKSGDLIAEIAFKKPGKAGTDVYGNEIAFTTPSLPPITVGQHVENRGGTHFYAQKDGIPQLTDNSIGIEPAYIHQGNVNLSSGNIVFDGPVVITGNVEHGALVSAAGDLEIQGVIEECVVKCGGSLTASGVISGPKGIVRVGGDAKVAFISNATLEVRGSLSVTGNITGSNVMVKKDIHVGGEQSLIVGGHLEFGENVTCKNLGRSSGQVTKLTGGFDPFLARRVAILSKRLERLMAHKDEIKKGSRHLSNLKTASTTKRHADKRENLKEAMTHIVGIIGRLEERLTAAQTQMVPHDDVKISVSGILASNCRISLNGKAIAVQQDVAEVAVTAKRVKGSFLTPLQGETPDDPKQTA
jgi:uncharacterized protein (DUF342 family)